MYLIIWEFRSAQGAEKEFEDHYGPQGVWARFFQAGEGYIRTELLHDTRDDHRYLTIDYWTSQQEYETFRNQHADEYKAINRRYESLTARETHVGSFIIK